MEEDGNGVADADQSNAMPGPRDLEVVNLEVESMSDSVQTSHFSAQNVGFLSQRRRGLKDMLIGLTHVMHYGTHRSNRREFHRLASSCADIAMSTAR